jgi:hypothetical protein
MTSTISQAVGCSQCQQTSNQELLASSNEFGSPDLDLRPAFMIRNTMECWLQQCPHCGYIASDLAETPAQPRRTSDAEYRAVLENDRFPKLARRFLGYSHYFPSGSELAAMACLRAAWVCDDANLARQALECRQQSSSHFEQLPIADDEETISRSAVFVDVLRRSQQIDEALQLCQTLLTFACVKEVLRQVIEFQQKLCSQTDTGCYTIEDAVKGTK